MIKMITILFAALCTIQTYASEQYLYTDTVQCKSHGGSLDILQPLEPTYLDGVLVPAGGSGNWFVTVAGGLNAFLGTPLGCDDLFGRIKPAYSFAVGKWFTPAVGGRINYNGMAFKDGLLSEQKYHHVHADLMWNILGRRYARQEQVRWTVAPFAGVGMIHHATNGNNPFALSYGIQGQYRLSKRIGLLVELSGMTTFKNFDGIGRPNRPGDNMLLLTAGLSFSIGKSGWKRVVDAGPYMQMNERLVSRTGSLSAENRYYAGLNDKNSRALAELKKVLEIEGLLDKYSHLFVDGNEQAGRTFPVNNYSGLNSLLARLKNKKWNGKSVDESSNQDTVDSAEDCLFSCNDSVQDLELLEDSAYHCRSAQDSISGIKNSEYRIVIGSVEDYLAAYRLELAVHHRLQNFSIFGCFDTECQFTSNNGCYRSAFFVSFPAEFNMRKKNIYFSSAYAYGCSECSHISIFYDYESRFQEPD